MDVVDGVVNKDIWLKGSALALAGFFINDFVAIFGCVKKDGLRGKFHGNGDKVMAAFGISFFKIAAEILGAFEHLLGIGGGPGSLVVDRVNFELIFIQQEGSDNGGINTAGQKRDNFTAGLGHFENVASFLDKNLFDVPKKADIFSFIFFNLIENVFFHSGIINNKKPVD